MAMTRQTIRDGLVVGIIGYFAVAALYGAFDVVAARGPLYTVDVLSKALFRGLRDPGVLGLPMKLDTTAIFWYNAVHLAISLAIGLFVTGLLGYAERNPARARMVLFV